MTVKDLIAKLEALTDEEKKMPVTIYDTKYERYVSPQKPSRCGSHINIYDI